MSDSGPTASINVCKNVAQQIASDLSRETGAKIARTSLRYRNPANMPEPWQESILRQFDAQKDDSAASLEYFEQEPDGTAHYMKAIQTGPVCLVCHGPAISEDVRAALDEHYPFDRARDYELGDIRGAFSVTWPARLSEAAAGKTSGD